MDRNNNDSDLQTTYKKNQLAYLDDLKEWEVKNDDMDVRGWRVYATNGEIVGEIKRLIVSPAQLRVRYLDVELDHDVIDVIKDIFRRTTGTDYTHSDHSPDHEYDDRHVLIPIGIAHIDHDSHKVWIPGFSIGTYYSLPRHRYGEAISPAYEATTLNFYDRNYLDRSGDYDRVEYRPDRYRDAEYMEDNFYNCEYFHDRTVDATA